MSFSALALISLQLVVALNYFFSFFHL